MKIRKILLIALATAVGISSVGFNGYASGSTNVNISIDTNAERKTISPYIYGINYNNDTENLTTTVIRQGGNRTTGYNWENNFSNAGMDWYHNSDTYLIDNLPKNLWTKSGLIAIDLSNQAKLLGVDYTMTTLQMAGYVAKDANGPVLITESAPSDRWVEVVPKKGSNFSLTPDLTDKFVYMDEYVNYLVANLGDSTTLTGIKGYSLDNEPALWSSTHSLIQTSPLNCTTLMEKTIALAKAVKAVDKNAEIFGPALYGMNGYDTLQNAPDWESIKENYSWFIDYYLSVMKKAQSDDGTRLLDVLDIHYYSEAYATGCSRITECTDYSHIECNKTRMQATRTLWDSTYIENSWIGLWKKQYLPLIPTIQASINTYYPGTKLSLTEYNFGGGDHISGGIAQVDALGVFAEQGVYLATLWQINDNIPYQKSAINLYTNYDGNGASFGNTSVKAETSDLENNSVYASIDNKDDKTVKIILTNKSNDKTQKATISLANSKVNYTSAEAYGFNSTDSNIVKLSSVKKISNNTFTYELQPLSVVELIITGVEADVSTTGATTTVTTSPTTIPSTTTPPITTTTTYNTTTPFESSETTTTTVENSSQAEIITTTVPNNDSIIDSEITVETDIKADKNSFAPFIVIGSIVLIGGGTAFYLLKIKKY